MKTKTFLALADQLDKELEKDSELFFKQRPWLVGLAQEPEILPRSDEDIEKQIYIEMTIQEIVKKL